MDTAVFAFGFLLIAANAIVNHRPSEIWGLLTSGKDLNPDQVAAAHAHLFTMFGEFVFLIFLSTVAQASEDVGKAVLAFLAVLWVVWFMVNYQSISQLNKLFNPNAQ